ncbi:MAG TPA: hypothetical protein VIT65_11140 [Microlunatus sp.]
MVKQPGSVWLVPLGVLVVADLLENAIAWNLTDPVGTWTAAAVALAAISMVKWLAGAVVVGRVGYVMVRRIGGDEKKVRPGVERVRLVVFKHRLSVIPLAIFALVALVPAANILDQVPDVIRSWTEVGSKPWWPIVLAIVMLVLWAATAFGSGRARTQLFARNWTPKEHPGTAAGNLPAANRRPPLLWLLAAVALAAAAALVQVKGGEVKWVRVAAACSVPLAVFVLSLAIRRWPRISPLQPKHPRTYTRADLSLLLRMGDVFAVALVCVASIALVRATSAIVVLRYLKPDVYTSVAPTVFALVGLIGAGAVWAVAGAVLCGIDRRADRLSARGELKSGPTVWLTPRLGNPTGGVAWFAGVLTIGSLALFVGIAMFATLAARHGGPLFVFGLGILCLTGIVAGFGLLAQLTPPAELFGALGRRSTPVFTLFVIMVVFAGQVGVRTPIHAVKENRDGPSLDSRTGVGSRGVPIDPRPRLGNAITEWANDRVAGGVASCLKLQSDSEKEVELVPMVMVAAEGGGIRAAYWAAISVEHIAQAPCGSGAVVLSSGVSGGAVGLAAARFNDDRTPTDPASALDTLLISMSDGRALAAGLAGLLSRDFIYAATGIPLPLNRGGSWDFAWIDRAGLMEEAWNESALTHAKGGPATWRDLPFLDTPGTTSRRPDPDATPTGHLIMNSMSVAHACRIWISEIQLSDQMTTLPGTHGDRLTCSQTSAAGASQSEHPTARSIDLITEFGGYGMPRDNTLTGCARDLTVTTAAMLAARFPYVTPSGQIGPCSRPHTHKGDAIDQLVDGGYLENTGLGTLGDLAPTWLSAVRLWNTQQLTASTSQPRDDPKPRPRMILVPMIVYLDNDSGNDRAGPRQDITNEFLLPPLAKSRAGSGAIADQASLQRAVEVTNPESICPTADAACRRAVLEHLPRRVFAVYPASTPQIAAPLGWTLSGTSRKAMNTALKNQAATTCPPPHSHQPAPPFCTYGYGTLGDLLASLDGG